MAKSKRGMSERVPGRTPVGVWPAIDGTGFDSKYAKNCGSA